jgi:hypothetical protein
MSFHGERGEKHKLVVDANSGKSTCSLCARSAGAGHARATLQSEGVVVLKPVTVAGTTSVKNRNSFQLCATPPPATSTEPSRFASSQGVEKVTVGST